MLHDKDHTTTTLIVTLDWLAITHQHGATTYRLPVHNDPTELVGAMLLLLDRRAVTITRILIDVQGSRAGTYRRAAVALAEALGAQVGEITDLGRRHIETLVGTPQRNRAGWVAEGLRKAREVEPLAKSTGTAMSPVFEIVALPTSIYTPEQSAQRLRALLQECRRAKSFWRKIDSVDLRALVEGY